MADQHRGRGRFGILLALEHGPKHGYQIAKFLRDRTEGRLGLSFGALYPLLHKMEGDGYVNGSWETLGPAKRKKVYQLTEQGKAAVAHERDDYARFQHALGALSRQ